MLALLGMIVIAVCFYEAAKLSHRKAVPWALSGAALYIAAGLILLMESEKYILQNDTLSDALAIRWG